MFAGYLASMASAVSSEAAGCVLGGSAYNDQGTHHLPVVAPSFCEPLSAGSMPVAHSRRKQFARDEECLSMMMADDTACLVLEDVAEDPSVSSCTSQGSWMQAGYCEAMFLDTPPVGLLVKNDPRLATFFSLRNYGIHDTSIKAVMRTRGIDTDLLGRYAVFGMLFFV